MNRLFASMLCPAIASVLVAACAKNEPIAEVVRPVRAAVVTAQTSSTTVFAGEVRPRHETRLAFRIGGQIVERRVELGTAVRAGDAIAVVDGRDLRLAEAAARANLAQAENQAELAQSDFRRYGELRARNFISQAEFERRQAQWRQARDSAEAARAEAMRTSNQAGYAVLAAPHAGVITAIEAEAGQVVAAGQTVVRLARPEEKEIAFSVPENQLREVRSADGIEVALWHEPDRSFKARLREVSPVADPSSRTYAARATLIDAGAGVGLGMSAEVRVRSSVPPMVVLPPSAIFHQNGRPAVWLVEGDAPQVRLSPVELGPASGEQVVVRTGLEPGQVVVTAGVHVLQPGAKVRLVQEATIVSNRP